jgi:hypothetical protein
MIAHNIGIISGVIFFELLIFNLLKRKSIDYFLCNGAITGVFFGISLWNYFYIHKYFHDCMT